MRLSRATGYALHAFAYLAKQKDAAPVSTKVIAKATGIPDVFLLRVVRKSKSGEEGQGLVRVRGQPPRGRRLARRLDLPQEVYRDIAQRRQHPGRRPRTHPAGVLPERHITHVVQPILYPPMLTH